MLRAHHVVRAAVCLPGDDRDLRDRCLAVRKEELRPVADDPAVFLLDAGEEPRDVDERQEADVERIAEPHEPRGLDRRIDVERAREDLRLIPDDADRIAFEPREAHDDVPRPMLVHLEPGSAVDDSGDDVAHVVRLVGLPRHDGGELRDVGIVGHRHDGLSPARQAASQPALPGRVQARERVVEQQHR